MSKTQTIQKIAGVGDVKVDKQSFKPKLPLNSEQMMFGESLIDNSGIDVSNTWIASFYRLYFYNKLLAIIDFENLPESIDKRYFKNAILTTGYVVILDTEEYGLIANKCTIYDYDIYYNPTKARTVLNRAPVQYERTINEDCALIKLSPNFETVLPIIYMFADFMSLTLDGIDNNIEHAKNSFVFACESQSVAQSFKKMADEVFNGYPVFADKKLFDDEGRLRMQMFNRDIKNTYIADKLEELKTSFENDFNAFIGLNAVNTDKKERLITSEVELSNNNNKLLIELWQETIQEGLDVANGLFGTNIKCVININNDERGEVNEETEAANVPDNSGPVI